MKDVKKVVIPDPVTGSATRKPRPAGADKRYNKKRNATLPGGPALWTGSFTIGCAETNADGCFAIVIPVYNHAEGIVSVIERARPLALPIWVIDDGSTDGTTASLQRIAGITVLRHEKNLGKGAAILTGFSALRGTADWAVTLDADGQHDPQDALALIRAIPQGLRPIVVGRREGMSGADVPWTSRFGRKFSNFWVRAAGGPVLSDTQSGMRVYPLPESLQLGVRARRFQFEVEILVRARWQGIPVCEAPVGVSYAYAPGRERVSHFRPFVDFCRNTATFSRLIFLRIIGLIGLIGDSHYFPRGK